MSARALLYTAAILSLFVIVSCQKELDPLPATAVGTPAPVPPGSNSQWVEHLIIKGEHSSDKSPFKQVTVSEMKFLVRFNNTAVYQTLDTNNQRDINKLYGFADNNQDHHTNSARIGWRWYQDQLQLFGYIYNNTAVKYQLITAVPMDQDINCSIRVEPHTYIFTVNGTQTTMPRTAADPRAVGYQLYPYFGGDEVAPHDISIKVKDL
jgi:hypothetical protein